jgi:DNA-binding helix-hairpin-helix protein with protein kinase domain
MMIVPAAAVPVGGVALLIASFLLVLTVLLATGRLNLRNAEYRVAQESLERARANLQTLENRWGSETAATEFDTILASLQNKKTELDSLSTLRQRRIEELVSRQRDLQLERFLDGFRIDRAGINGIGPSRAATLQSYGIETALDVREWDVLTVPGFGPTFTQRLVEWRRSVESRFVFNPSRQIPQQEIDRIDAEISVTRTNLERYLQLGPQSLNRARQQIQTRRDTLYPMLEHAIKAVAQAQAEVAVF